MRSYEEFAARLRREISGAGLERDEPDWSRIDRPERSRGGAWRPAWAAAAAALAVAVGFSGYGTWRSYDGRRAVAEQTTAFVEALLARGLFDVVPMPGALADTWLDEPLYESPDPPALSVGLPWASD
jgi:hypothetical protein